MGWQTHCVTKPEADDRFRVVPDLLPIPTMLNVMGTTGITAYYGLIELGDPKPGETVLVSGAAGATGSVVVQIAKLKGCHVIGIAGGKEKCDWLKEVGVVWVHMVLHGMAMNLMKMKKILQKHGLELKVILLKAELLKCN